MVFPLKLHDPYRNSFFPHQIGHRILFRGAALAVYSARQYQELRKSIILALTEQGNPVMPGSQHFQDGVTMEMVFYYERFLVVFPNMVTVR
jgi:hypothetical protein